MSIRILPTDHGTFTWRDLTYKVNNLAADSTRLGRGNNGEFPTEAAARLDHKNWLFSYLNSGLLVQGVHDETLLITG